MAKKSTPKAQPKLEPVFSNVQFTKPADQLLEAVRQYYQRIKGESISKTEMQKVVSDIVESRL